MRMYDLIEKKKLGEALSEEEIRFFISGYTAGEIPDYQASALCMAIYFQGMSDEETAILTDAMAHSGDMLDLSRFGDLSADKHSTGGVGDKTSLIVAPIAAGLGAKVSKMSGRGLGHTGGTIDKLESIPGYDTALSEEAFLKQVEDIGIAVVGQTGNLTPADKKLYALRDVTATVDTPPLIVSSIMSKKLAAGSHNIVLDVKAGSGSFNHTMDAAKSLAEKMVNIGRLCGRNMTAVLTNMDVPLGCAIGNAVEVKEAVAVLKGSRDFNDLRTVSLTLASELVRMVFGWTKEEAYLKAEEALTSGKAYAKMKEWIAAQGGDVRYIEDTSLFEETDVEITVHSPVSGYIAHRDTEAIGKVSVTLGAGRATKEESIDPAAGILIHKKTGDYVEEDEPLCTLLTNRNSDACEEAVSAYLDALTFSENAPEELPLILEIVTAEGK